MSTNVLVTRPSLPPMDEYINEIKDLWENYWITNMGEKHQLLQSQLKSYLQTDHIELMVNGHMSLELTLQAMKLQGEVITTPYTFVSTTHAIVRSGLTPIFCDIDPDTYTMDVEKIESLITEDTSAILPVHVYGNVCNIEEIEKIANKYDLKVIYDACHSFGETYKGKGVGSYGNASCFSFHATKVFHSIEGGAVCYREPELGKRLEYLKNFGIDGPESVLYIGANAKMNEFSAAMGICNLRHIEQEIEKRKHIDHRYKSHLEGVKGIKLRQEDPNVLYNYAYFPAVFESEFGATRNEVFDALAQEGIEARKYFYPIANSLECYRRRFDVSETPNALHLSNHILTLPIYSELAVEEVDHICEIILKLQGKRFFRIL